jgi:CBS domain-containing protein
VHVVALNQGGVDMLHAQDIMTRKVVTVRSDSTISEAAAQMVRHRISAVPVVDDGLLVGIISEGDLVHRAEIGTAGRSRSWWLTLFRDPSTMAKEYARSHSRHVADLMTRTVRSVEEKASVEQIAELMDRARIKRVPVTRGGAVVGIVSRADLVKAIAGAKPEDTDAHPSDEGIRTRLLEEASATQIGVEVRDGFVSFWGTVNSEEERRASRILAENLAGVRGVEDHRLAIDFPAYAL